MAADQDSRADWDHWRHVGKCQLWEAGTLTVNIDPRCFQMSPMGSLIQIRGATVDPGGVRTIVSRIEVAISNLGNGIPDHSPWVSRPPRQATVVLSEFGEWAPADWNLPADFPGTKPKAQQAVGWPWGSYETPLLKELAEAAKHFWTGNPDPKSAPTNDAVIAWLTKRGVASERNADAIARILRRPGLPHGPREKKFKK